MTALEAALGELFVFLRNAGLSLPRRDVWLVELEPNMGIDERDRARVRRSDYRDPAGYNSRFDELLAAGLPWINLSCYGVDGDRLLVVIEVPSNSVERVARTSVNFSGPTKAVMDRGWDVSEVLAISDR